MSTDFTRTIVSNWTAGDELRVNASGSQAGSDVPPLISLVQDSGSMRFHFSVLPGQARELAAALLRSAEEAERVA